MPYKLARSFNTSNTFAFLYRCFMLVFFCIPLPHTALKNFPYDVLFVGSVVLMMTEFNKTLLSTTPEQFIRLKSNMRWLVRFLPYKNRICFFLLGLFFLSCKVVSGYKDSLIVHSKVPVCKNDNRLLLEVCTHRTHSDLYLCNKCRNSRSRIFWVPIFAFYWDLTF